MMVTTGGVNGPVTRPAAPAVWSMTATDGRDRPTAAATGIASGARIALAPARVPRAPTRTVDASMIPICARVELETPILRSSIITRVRAAPVVGSDAAQPGAQHDDQPDHRDERTQ